VKKQLTDEEILEKYREVFDRYAKGGVIDMDRRLKFKFFYQIHPLGQVVSALNGFNIDFFLHQAFPRKYIIERKVFKASLRPWLIL
jgi:hypothetical protein